jgi:hypothetical protein
MLFFLEVPMILLRNGLIALMLSLLVGACGVASLGETCKTAGATTEECEAGTTCTNASDTITCRKTCTVQADCATGETCNGISGSTLKSCQAG